MNNLKHRRLNIYPTSLVFFTQRETVRINFYNMEYNEDELYIYQVCKATSRDRLPVYSDYTLLRKARQLNFCLFFIQLVATFNQADNVPNSLCP